ncbi:SURF1 family protein [Leekyejoonella antrihumi]|uniref:SURF1 family cytochrome oxidase biogenesis protein n=1 Tax=Leekyejoonella antrihumi TaxID=1660198 RepID=UPI0016490454|nr:SURF1 family protein [Leekyejoonella antrihumi]
MLRLLMTRRWLAWLAVAAVWGVGCFYLGRWQWHRYESKHTLQHQMNDNYNGTPASIASLLPSESSVVTSDKQWRQVRLLGTYDASHRVLVRNRPNNGNYGYEVVIPFRLKSGANILVDRGWIPNGNNASAPNSVPPTPTGQVTVTGWLRPPEQKLNHQPVAGQVPSINLADIKAVTGLDTYNAYVLMRDEKTAAGVTPPRPQALPKPDPGSYAGINMSYAFQWWLGMVAGFAYVVLRCRREHLDEVNGPREPKLKKVRIWDEEDA